MSSSEASPPSAVQAVVVVAAAGAEHKKKKEKKEKERRDEEEALEQSESSWRGSLAFNDRVDVFDGVRWVEGVIEAVGGAERITVNTGEEAAAASGQSNDQENDTQQQQQQQQQQEAVGNVCEQGRDDAPCMESKADGGVTARGHKEEGSSATGTGATEENASLRQQSNPELNDSGLNIVEAASEQAKGADTDEVLPKDALIVRVRREVGVFIRSHRAAGVDKDGANGLGAAVPEQRAVGDIAPPFTFVSDWRSMLRQGMKIEVRFPPSSGTEVPGKGDTATATKWFTRKVLKINFKERLVSVTAGFVDWCWCWCCVSVLQVGCSHSLIVVLSFVYRCSCTCLGDVTVLLCLGYRLIAQANKK